MSEPWPSAALEAEMLQEAEHVAQNANEGSSAANLCCHVKALLTRVRELEAASVLDYFAGQALPAIVATETHPREVRWQAVVLDAYGLAEAMLAEKRRREAMP